MAAPELRIGRRLRLGERNKFFRRLDQIAALRDTHRLDRYAITSTAAKLTGGVPEPLHGAVMREREARKREKQDQRE